MFLDDQHKKAFEHFLKEADLVWDESCRCYDEVLRRQLGFLYILAYYQEDYIKYEGEGFYVEMFEDLEIGGPTYLLEKEVTLREKYSHEWLIKWAKKLLIGETMTMEGLSDQQKKLYERAKYIANSR